jgi:hypothetical protein
MFIFCQTLNISSIFAEDNSASSKQPSVSIQSSKYISFTNTKLVTSNGAVIFEGDFIVLGEGIYGHFDLIAYTDSGKIIQKVKSDDRAWRKLQGSRVKSISVSLGSVTDCSKVEVSFHEMMADRDSGAYLSD